MTANPWSRWTPSPYVGPARGIADDPRSTHGPAVFAPRAFRMTTTSTIDVMAEFGILEAHEVARLLKLRHSTVLELSRRGVLPAFKIGKHWRYRRADLEAWLGVKRDAA